MSQLTNVNTDPMDALVEYVSQNYDLLTQYSEHEFSHGRRVGFFEPGGVGPPNKRQVVSTGVGSNNTLTRSNSTYPKKNMRKTYKRKYTKKPSLAAQMRKVALRQAEIKNWNNGTTATLTHSTQQAFVVTAGVNQGTSVAQRIGDEITLNRLRAQVLIAAPTTAGAYSYRILVGMSGEEYSNTAFSAASITFSEMFLPGAVAGSNVAAVVNTKSFTVLVDQIVSINSNITATSDVVHYPINLNLKNVKFAYQTPGSAFGKFKNLFFVVVPYVVGGTTGTTACGTATVNISLDFRDM